MRTVTVATWTLLAALVWASQVFAGAESGFGIALGTGNLTVTEPILDSSEDQAVIEGVFDYQIALGDAFSVNLFGGEFGANDELKEIPDLKLFKVSNIGLQVRLWLGQAFIGAHAANYLLTTADDAFAVSISNGKQGQGLVTGYEAEDGWFVLARTDQVKGLEAPDDGPELDVTSTRLAFGYRFK